MIYRMAYEQVQHNLQLLKPGLSFREVAERARSLPPDYLPQRYGLHFHGVGLCDEFPFIKYFEDWDTSGYDGVLQEGMVLCVESYVGRLGGHEGVKLEEQVVLTHAGYAPISSYPFEESLLGLGC